MAQGRLLSHFPVGVASRTCLANLSWDILDAWPNQRSWDISIQRSGSTYRIYEFNSCALCREVSRRELFAKIPSLPLALGIV